MSGPPNNADADREGFTCSALLMCLYPPGRSGKKKPEEEEATTSTPQAEAEPAPDHKPAEEEQEPPQVPGRTASFDKFECASLYSGNNIVFDFVEEDGDYAAAGAPPPAVHQGWCPSPCFDLPVELIRASERYGSVAAACDTPVTAAFVFGDYQGAALKKMASCLASGVEGRAPHLVRFLSESGSGAPRPPDTLSRDAPPKATAVDGDHCEFADDGARAQRRTGGFPEQGTVV